MTIGNSTGVHGTPPIYTTSTSTTASVTSTGGTRSPAMISGTQDQHQIGSTGHGKNPLDGMPEPGDIDRTHAEGAAARLGMLDSDQVTADIYTFMALFQKLAQQMRNTAREQRGAELQEQVSALQNAAEKMKDAAQQRFAAAMIQGAFQIAGGAMQIGSAMYAGSQMMGTRGQKQLEADFSKAQNSAYGGQQKQMHLDALQGSLDKITAANASATKWNAIGQASGGIAGGMGSMIAAGFSREADFKEAEKAKLEVQAKQHEAASQNANDMMQQMMDIIRDVRDKLASIQQSAVETNRGIARNI